jgi:hypothetical protein
VLFSKSRSHLIGPALDTAVVHASGRPTNESSRLAVVSGRLARLDGRYAGGAGSGRCSRI